MLHEKSAITSRILVEFTMHRPIKIGCIQISVYISVKMTILDLVHFRLLPGSPCKQSTVYL